MRPIHPPHLTHPPTHQSNAPITTNPQHLLETTTTMCAGAILPASHSHLKVDCIRVNGVGTMVAALATSPDAAREPTLFVYFSELSTPLVYDFSKDAKLPQVGTQGWGEALLLSSRRDTQNGCGRGAAPSSN